MNWRVKQEAALNRKRWLLRSARVGWRAIALIALTGCGGGGSEIGLLPLDRSKPIATVAAPPFEAGEGVSAGSPSEEAGSPAEYELSLFKQKFNRTAQHLDTDTLIPVRGNGYPTLYAFVHLNEKYRPSPVAGIHAFCATPTRCEYLPPRRAGSPERFTISLSDDSFARLSATDDLVAVSARQMDVAKPVTVVVTLTIPEQPPITRKITYAGPAVASSS